MIQPLFGSTPTVQPRSSSQLMVIDVDASMAKIATSLPSASMTSSILASVKASDLDVLGGQLNQLISVSKEIDPTTIGKKTIFGKITSIFSSGKETMLAQYQSVETRMNDLVSEIERNVDHQRQRINDLEQMFKANEAEYYQCSDAITQYQALHSQLKDSINQIDQTDGFAAQRMQDINTNIDRVEQQIDNCQRLMHLRKLTAPEIRAMQATARSLISTFGQIISTTIPAWQSAFSRYVISSEQKKSAALVTAVQDATNIALRTQADQVRENVAATAKAQHRAVIDIETLEHMQTQLIGAYNDAQKAADDARAARLTTQQRLSVLDTQLASVLIKK